LAVSNRNQLWLVYPRNEYLGRIWSSVGISEADFEKMIQAQLLLRMGLRKHR
jgi:hypothetical protein